MQIDRARLFYRNMSFKCISIVGVGLLGGSLGLAIKSVISDCHVIGYGHRKSTLDRALEIGAIDEAVGSLHAIGDCDLTVLCTPVGLFEEILKGIGGSLRTGSIVTDVGSTKRSVVELAGRLLPRSVQFVGSHPMAGSEKRGVEFARADLFRGALCILTPDSSTDSGALRQVGEFWTSIGMRLTRLSPAEHDRLLSDVSHLPHVVAAALLAIQEEASLSLAGKGFLDTTRVASGDGRLWRDILLDNRENLSNSLGKLRKEIGRLEGMLKAGQGEELAAWLNESGKRRDELVARKLKEIEPG